MENAKLGIGRRRRLDGPGHGRRVRKFARGQTESENDENAAAKRVRFHEPSQRRDGSVVELAGKGIEEGFKMPEQSAWFTLSASARALSLCPRALAQVAASWRDVDAFPNAG
jgi:hypothetical protein